MKAEAAPVRGRFFTPGVFVLLGLVALGLAAAAWRFTAGLGAATNLDNQYPWGIWIAIDVATGVALAAGGFTSAALAHIFHRGGYGPLTRPALLTALLGYTFVVLGLLADLGRYYNVWHPIVPFMWSGHSALFEVGMCVMAYLTVLYLEFLPIVLERVRGHVRLPGPFQGLEPAVERVLGFLDTTVGKVMWVFIILGVVLSTLHQSSLGALMVLAPSKIHPLWWTPILPLLFLLSAIAVGFPMVIVESIAAARSLGRKPEMHLLTPLSKMIPIFLFIYLAFKVSDLTIRGAWGHLSEGGARIALFLIEILLGVVAPLVMLLLPRVRRSPRLLFLASLLVVLGVALNRVNVFLTAYQPYYATWRYFPSPAEIAVTVGLASGLILVYRAAVFLFPVLPAEKREEDRTSVGFPPGRRRPARDRRTLAGVAR